MASKFLPFVTSNSTRLQVFTTFASRAKGVSRKDTVTILRAIYSLGIAEVKAYVKTLPELQTEELYRELSSRYSRYSPSESEMYAASLLTPKLPYSYISKVLPEELTGSFTPEEVITYLQANLLEDEPSDTDATFGIDVNTMFSAHEKVLADIKNVVKLNSESKTVIEVDLIYGIKGFIIAQAALPEGKRLNTPVRLKLVKERPTAAYTPGSN